MSAIKKAVTLDHLVEDAAKAKLALETAIQEVVAPVSASFTLPTTGWTNGSGVTGHPYYYDLTASGATATDIAAVTIAPGSQGTALACGLCATNETRAGAIRFYAASAPAAAITGSYILQKTSAASA